MTRVYNYISSLPCLLTVSDWWYLGSVTASVPGAIASQLQTTNWDTRYYFIQNSKVCWKTVFWVTEHFCIKWTFWKNAFFCPKNAFFLTKMACWPPAERGGAAMSRKFFWGGILLLKSWRILLSKMEHMVKPPTEHVLFSQKLAIFARFENKSFWNWLEPKT